MNENRKSSSTWQFFFTIDLNNTNNNNNVATCKTCDYKLSHGNNSKIWGIKCIAVYYLIPVGYLI